MKRRSQWGEEGGDKGAWPWVEWWDLMHGSGGWGLLKESQSHTKSHARGQLKVHVHCALLGDSIVRESGSLSEEASPMLKLEPIPC